MNNYANIVNLTCDDIQEKCQEINDHVTHSSTAEMDECLINKTINIYEFYANYQTKHHPKIKRLIIGD